MAIKFETRPTVSEQSIPLSKELLCVVFAHPL